MDGYQQAKRLEEVPVIGDHLQPKPDDCIRIYYENFNGLHESHTKYNKTQNNKFKWLARL